MMLIPQRPMGPSHAAAELEKGEDRRARQRSLARRSWRDVFVTLLASIAGLGLVAVMVWLLVSMWVNVQ